MDEGIKNFALQFEFVPEIINEDRLKPASAFAVVGMGGSHLAADLIKLWKPRLYLDIHKNYRLPSIPPEKLGEHLVILSSYSGNTEEVLDAFDESSSKGLNTAVISTGGKLLELAKEYHVPYIQLPNRGVPSRLALGLSVKAHLKLMGEEDALAELTKLAAVFDPVRVEARGRELATKISNKTPLIYSSAKNAALAYNWKIKFNETGKIPAFYNVFPELNHNEMQGFDTFDDKFCFVFLKDKSDHPRVQKRMTITKKLLVDRGFPIAEIKLEGENVWHKIFGNLLLADWASYYVAQNNGVDPAATPMIEEFKRLL